MTQIAAPIPEPLRRDLAFILGTGEAAVAPRQGFAPRRLFASTRAAASIGFAVALASIGGATALLDRGGDDRVVERSATRPSTLAADHARAGGGAMVVIEGPSDRPTARVGPPRPETAGLDAAPRARRLDVGSGSPGVVGEAASSPSVARIEIAPPATTIDIPPVPAPRPAIVEAPSEPRPTRIEPERVLLAAPAPSVPRPSGTERALPASDRPAPKRKAAVRRESVDALLELRRQW